MNEGMAEHPEILAQIHEKPADDGSIPLCPEGRKSIAAGSCEPRHFRHVGTVAKEMTGHGFTPEEHPAPGVIKAEALYLGVEKYGAREINKETIADFRYRFRMDGKEAVFRIDPRDLSYPIQNRLKENYRYVITAENDMVISVTEIPAETKAAFEPVVRAVPGKRTLGNFLRTAAGPAGTVLYVYGGGWDWQDKGSSIQARTIGISPDWVKFFREHDGSYTYKSKDGKEENADPAVSFYPYGGFNEYYYAGLDCSGYLGWVIYNTFETESGRDGCVGEATGFAKRLSAMGYGEWTQDVKVTRPGDILSMNGHVWISLGTCRDGSVVILHSTPAYSRSGQPGGGVEISAIGDSKACEAYQLADRYMSEFFPQWYERYPVKLEDPETCFSFEGETAGCFSWDAGKASAGLTDPEKLQELGAEEVLAYIFHDAAAERASEGGETITGSPGSV